MPAARAALLLAARRQRAIEIALKQKDRDQAHQERVAAATEADAAERRITELYTRAAEQLGADKAPVRLAGLYALERLAQDNPSQRQSIVNLLCAYLRMPYTLPDDPGDHAGSEEVAVQHRERVQEREVRLTAQHVLTAHLRPGRGVTPADTFWPDTDLELTGAVLINLDLSMCHLRTATFSQAEFIGGARFNYARFTGSVWFGQAVFAGTAAFQFVEFAETAWFRTVKFAGEAVFAGAKFARAWFYSAEFASYTSFQAVRFAGEANFDQVKFRGAMFSEARFADDATFSEARFAEDVTFSKARFAGNAAFRYAKFASNASFIAAEFARRASFGGAEFACPAPGAAQAAAVSEPADETSFAKVVFAQAVPPEVQPLWSPPPAEEVAEPAAEPDRRAD